MARKVGKAILPGHRSDPTNTDRLERGAFNRFVLVMRAATRAYRKALMELPVRAIQANKRYEFRLDEGALARLLAGPGDYLDSLLFTGYRSTWLFDDYVQKSFNRGVSQSRNNIAKQARIPLSELVQTDPYKLRMGLVQLREFEEMQALSASVKTDMSRILTDGIGRGLNPLDIAKNLAEQTDINIRRAERIARTEINTALRRARMEEDEALMEEYDIKTMQMHFSALSPTTRESHAARHGNLYTIEQQQEWWSQDANSINCYLPGTKVQGRFVGGSKSYYRGEVFEVVTASGRNITVTPNHPIMTDRGMVAAAMLSEGDNLVAHGVEVEYPVGVRDLNSEKVDSRIEDVFASLVDLGHSNFTRVGAVDFHGDGRFMDKHIHIVDMKGMLSCYGEPATFHALDDLSLEHTYPIPRVAHGDRARLPSGNAVSLAPAGNMGGPSAVFSKLWSELFGTSSGGLGATHPVESHGLEDPVNLNARNADLPAYFEDALASPMLGVNSAKVVKVSEPQSLDTASFDERVNSILVDTSPSGDDLSAITGEVFFDSIISIRNYDFCGHVYDLEEVSGLMVANGLIASNCKCTTISVQVDASGNPLDPNIQKQAKRIKSTVEARRK